MDGKKSARLIMRQVPLSSRVRVEWSATADSQPSNALHRPTESARSVDRIDRVVSAATKFGQTEYSEYCTAVLPCPWETSQAGLPSVTVAYTVQDRTNRLLLNAPIFPAMSVQRKALHCLPRSAARRSTIAAACPPHIAKQSGRPSGTLQ